MGPMPNLPVAPGQQDLPFGMPYGPISMAYTYPYTSASPAMMYSQVKMSYASVSATDTCPYITAFPVNF